MLPPTEVHTLYSLTTFYVSCLGFFQKNFLPVKAGGGEFEGVKRRVQKKIKILKFDVISANFSIFVA